MQDKFSQDARGFLETDGAHDLLLWRWARRLALTQSLADDGRGAHEPVESPPLLYLYHDQLRA